LPAGAGPGSSPSTTSPAPIRSARSIGSRQLAACATAVLSGACEPCRGALWPRRALAAARLGRGALGPRRAWPPRRSVRGVRARAYEAYECQHAAQHGRGDHRGWRSTTPAATTYGWRVPGAGAADCHGPHRSPRDRADITPHLEFGIPRLLPWLTAASRRPFGRATASRRCLRTRRRRRVRAGRTSLPLATTLVSAKEPDEGSDVRWHRPPTVAPLSTNPFSTWLRL